MPNEIKDVINNVLKGDAHKNAMDFVNFLSANEMFIDGSVYHGIKYKDKDVCFLKIDGDGSDNAPGHWTIWSADDYNNVCVDFPVDEHIKKFAWTHICFCGSCGGKCSPGRSVAVFGKEFDKVCHCALIFTDPDTETLDGIKKLMEIRKLTIATEETK